MHELDLPFDDFLQGNVRGTHGRAGWNQRGTPAVELADALGDKVNKNERVGDNFRCLFNKITFHGRAGKERGWPSLLEGDDILRGLGLGFFAQNKLGGEVAGWV